MQWPLGLPWGGLSKRQYISNEGIELQATTEIWVEAVKHSVNSKYINSLLVKETHDTIFSEKRRPICPLIMGPLLIY
jgi:hypothetical protein